MISMMKKTNRKHSQLRIGIRCAWCKIERSLGLWLSLLAVLSNSVPFSHTLNTHTWMHNCTAQSPTFPILLLSPCAFLPIHPSLLLRITLQKAWAIMSPLAKFHQLFHLPLEKKFNLLSLFQVLTICSPPKTNSTSIAFIPGAAF